jgi:negative regulator of flagellin synthesis FlgM
MKIHNDVSHALHSTDKSTTSKTGGNSAAQATSSAPSVGSVSISDTSRALQGTSSSDAPFDAKRVDAIKAAISSGQFKVNPEAIADKVIDSATQLLSSKS